MAALQRATRLLLLALLQVGARGVKLPSPPRFFRQSNDDELPSDYDDYYYDDIYQ